MPQFNNPTATITKLAKGDLLMGGNPDEFSNILADNLFCSSYTYAELLALSVASELVVGAKYKITNATSANINLEVEAISATAIHCDAKDPLYPNDVVMYNFASNVITWRWDSVNDISAGEDWRNSNNIQIGSGCSKISIGLGCAVEIGNNCSNIEIGNNCTINLFAGSSEVYCFSNSGISNPSSVTTNTRVYRGTAVLDNTISGVVFESASNFTAFSNKALLYNNNGVVSNGEGDLFFTYITSGVLTTTLLA